MKGHWDSRANPRRRKGRITAPKNLGDQGFTVIELLIVCTILPLIIGAISVALVSVFSLQTRVSNRLSDSTDAQTVSATFQKDVQSSLKLTTYPPATCGSGTQLLGLEWSLNPLSGYQTIVSYVQTSSGSLVRQYCSSGPSSTPTSTSVISGDIPSGQAPPSITPSIVAPSAARGYISAVGVTGVSLAITEPKSSYSYTILAVPATSSSAASLSNGQVATPALPTTSCGFATAGTGTYASTLCFADFTPYVAPPAGCDTLTAALANFTLSYCLLVTGGPTLPHIIPTYSQSFLGINGFYTGIPGEPAIYQSNSGTTTTLTITNIKVLSANGSPATGWQFVSGDAESTDAGEDIQWTSDKNLALLPDSPTSAIGNACGYSPAPPSSTFANAYLTGLGTTTVECQANSFETSGAKTGTVLLEAPAPTSLTVVMRGSGLQAIFIGLLLPG